jgi:hypothetical protein
MIGERVKRVAVVAGVIAALVGGALVLAYRNVTDLARAAAERNVPGLTFSAIELGWNRLEVADVRLERKGQTALKVDRLQVYPSLRSLFTQTIEIASIEVHGPSVHLVRDGHGGLELLGGPARGRKRADPAEDSKGQASSRGLHIGRIEVRGGRGELVDHSVVGVPAKWKISGLDVTLRDVAAPVRPGKIAFEVATRLDAERIGTLRTRGWYDPGSDAAEVDFRLDDAFLPLLEPYLRGKHTTTPIRQGLAALEVRLRLANGEYVAPSRLELWDVGFSREGLFLGAPTSLVRKLLSDGARPLVVEVELRGKVSDPSALQRQLLAALLKEVGKEVAAGGLSGLTAQPEGVLKSLFGR